MLFCLLTMFFLVYRYTDSPGVGAPPPPAPSSPTSSRRERRGSPHSQGHSSAQGHSQGSKESKQGGKVRVPQSFGYVKRNSASNGTSISPGPQQGNFYVKNMGNIHNLLAKLINSLKKIEKKYKQLGNNQLL